MVSQINSLELKLNSANTSDIEASFLDLQVSISDDIVSTIIFNKRDDFDFEIVNFPFLDGEVPCSTSYVVYISQLIRFAPLFSLLEHLAMLETSTLARNFLLGSFLKKGIGIINLAKCVFFSKFYGRFVQRFDI